MVDLGYRLFKKHWGKGYATESSRAILTYGFVNYGIEEVIGRTSQENIASIKVLEKLGMKFWKKGVCEGIEDSLFYRITREDWKN